MGWNKRINGKARIAKEIYIGYMENLTRIAKGHVDVGPYSLPFGTTAFMLLVARVLASDQ